MSKHILICPQCKKYTLSSHCSNDHETTLLARPPKFSLDDRYASYRRKIKLAELKAKGLY